MMRQEAERRPGKADGLKLMTLLSRSELDQAKEC
jgi:hypothetical protein